jgi:hypothetical protein
VLARHLPQPAMAVYSFKRAAILSDLFSGVSYQILLIPTASA